MSDADKTTKLYEMPDAGYRNLLIETIVIHYVHKLHVSGCWGISYCYFADDNTM